MGAIEEDEDYAANVSGRPLSNVVPKFCVRRKHCLQDVAPRPRPLLLRQAFVLIQLEIVAAQYHGQPICVQFVCVLNANALHQSDGPGASLEKHFVRECLFMRSLVKHDATAGSFGAAADLSAFGAGTDTACADNVRFDVGATAASGVNAGAVDRSTSDPAKGTASVCEVASSMVRRILLRAGASGPK